MATPTSSTVRCAPMQAGGLLGRARQTRQPYTTSDIRYVATHYPHTTAKACAAALGRTVGSVRQFIQARPELHKRGQP
ncbi:hypothetical protein IC235_17445 [Hymenobacter sp. BT664]|uniref:Uncharacterized protein n=1 Tax=Hymenobacter montanus TaxID=2771359 RepID=A0A927BGV9_9BACT|nr:hypothetical protein [Hymenobacter montanus]MBD2769678.1 hypothetical protein [Hymenobacter montanus]